MDRIWSKRTYRLREIVEDSSNCVMYCVNDGLERVHEGRVDAHSRKQELCPKMVIPIPVEWVLFSPNGASELLLSFWPHGAVVLPVS